MDDARDVTKDGQQDVDEQISSASALKENTDRWNNDRNDDLDDVAVDNGKSRVIVVIQVFLTIR